MLKGKEVATSQLRSSVTKAAEKLRSLDWSRLILFNANRREPAYCIHLVLAALFFSPFLLFGHVVAASTDSLLESYPSLLLARHDFFQHSLGLWNPYVFSGMPRAAEAVPALFFPEHWILFLVPSRYLFATITFFAFIKFWLVGVAAYHFYCAELLQRRWALFASIAFQLSGMTIWLLGVYVSGLSLMLFYLILLALIWTSARRTSLVNYLLWSVATTLMLMAGDIALSCYALLAAGILFLYRTLSRYGIEPIIGRLALFTASSLTALAIFSIRLFPTLAVLQTSSAESCCLPEFNSTTFLIARYFDTEILGVHFDASMEFFRNISHLFGDYHLHFEAPQFFGIAAALLALWMLASEKKTLKTVFWSIYVVVGLASVTHAQPFEFFVQYLLYPVGAVVGMQILFMVGLPALAALGGMSLEQCIRRARFQSLSLQLLGFALVVIAMFVLMILIGNIYPAEGAQHNWPRVLVIGLLFFCALILWTNHAYPVLVRASAPPILTGISVAALLVILFWTDGNPTYLSHLKNIAVQLLLFSSVALILTLISRDRLDQVKRFGLWTGVIIVPLCLFVILYPWTEILRLTVPHEDGLVLSSLGALRFALGVAILLLVVRLARSRQLPPRGVYIVFMVLLIAEQVPAGKIDSHIGDNPFYSNPSLYPPLRPLIDADNKSVDLADYRINSPNTMLRLQFIIETFGLTREPCADANAVYGIRSYGGYIDIVPDRLVQFIRNWTKIPGSLCIWATLADNRLLDLFAVGYQYDSKSATIIRRPKALSRFMLFTKFDVASRGETELQLLKGSEFDPRDEIVLQADPGFDSHPSSVNGRSLAYTNIDSDHAELRVQTDRPAILLFDDSFDPGWKATVNGQPQKVITGKLQFHGDPDTGRRKQYCL